MKRKALLEKPAAWGEPFSAAVGEQVVLPGAALMIRVLNVKVGYPGRRFEEMGDETRAEFQVDFGGETRTYRTDWYERDDPPYQAWRIGEFELQVLGGRGGYRLNRRYLWLKIEKAGG